MNRQSDPGAISDDQFWEIQNARLDGTGIKNRPGLSEVFSNPMPGCVFGIWDDRNPDDDGNAIFYNGGTNVAGYSPQMWTNAETTQFPRRIKSSFNGEQITIDDSGNGYAFTYVFDPTQGIPIFTETLVFTYDDSLSNAFVRSATEFDGALWFVYSSDDDGDAQIWKWTGGDTAVLETLLSSTDIRSILATDGEDLFFASQNQIRKRDGGAWTNLTFPGTLTTWTLVGWNGVSKPPYVYFAGVDVSVAAATRVMTILQVIGTTVTIANQQVPTYDGTNNNYGSIAAYHGYLYVIGVTVQGTNSFSLYQMTGANTVANVANLTTQVGTASAGIDIWIPLFNWRSQLWAVTPKVGIDAELTVSDHSDPTTWTAIGGSAGPVQATGRGTPIFSA